MADARQGSPGKLSVVGTPIGNLGDLSPRARDTLATADVIVCEDTRRLAKLLAGAGLDSTRKLNNTRTAAIQKIVANDHSEIRHTERVVDLISGGANVALVSDAGMPTISDPGHLIVEAVTAADLPIEVVPGPSAVSAALALSGFRVDRFSFEGFLPRKGSARAQRLASIAAAEQPVVIFESPHRVSRTLRDLADRCDSDRAVVVIRELTKLHEEARRHSLVDACKLFEPQADGAHTEPDRPESTTSRGEYVIVLDGAAESPSTYDDEELLGLVAELLAKGDLRKSEAVRRVAESTGVSRRRVYELVNNSVR